MIEGNKLSPIIEKLSRISLEDDLNSMIKHNSMCETEAVSWKEYFVRLRAIFMCRAWMVLRSFFLQRIWRKRDWNRFVYRCKN